MYGHHYQILLGLHYKRMYLGKWAERWRKIMGEDINNSMEKNDDWLLPPKFERISPKILHF